MTNSQPTDVRRRQPSEVTHIVVRGSELFVSAGVYRQRTYKFFDLNITHVFDIRLYGCRNDT